MKIGILTFHRPSNFGANLQAFCSSSYFKSLGHDTCVINYIRNIDDEYINRVNKTQYKAHINFVNKVLPITSEVRTPSQLQQLVKEKSLDLIVIGADAVWRSVPNDTVFFAKWLFDSSELSNVSVVSMSPAHMGVGFQNITNEQCKEIRSCLDRFAFISTRDTWTRDMINRDIYAGAKCLKIINPDPVFLLDRLNHIQWDSRGLESKKYIILSLSQNWANTKLGFINRWWFKRFKTIVNNAGYKLVELPIPEGISGLEFDYTVPYPIDPLQWFLWLKNAKAYCGLRFHAIVSCISAGTPFFSVDNYGTCTRKKQIQTLLGFYKQALKNDERSKIFDLLKGTKFEQYRIDAYIENVRPKRLYDMLMSVNEQDILYLRDERIKLYEANMQEMLKLVSHE